MKYLILILTIFCNSSILLTAQEKNLFCKSTLPLSVETVSKIFNALVNKSIFVKDSDSLYEVDPSICLEGEIQSTTENHDASRYVVYAFIATKSKDKAIEKYNMLLKEFKKCRPENWYITEKDFNQKETLKSAGQEENIHSDNSGVKYYMFTDKENYYTKQVGLILEKNRKGYVLQLWFIYHTPEGKKYMDILEGLKDGSLRGPKAGDWNEWKSEISLDGQINSYIQSEDYGKKRGTATAVYWFLDGEKGNSDESLRLFEELKQKLKMFKPEGWYSDDFEMTDKSIKRFIISKSSEGYTIDLFWNDGNDVFIQFVSTWEN